MMQENLVFRSFGLRVTLALAALLLCGPLAAQPEMARADASRMYHGYGFTISPPAGKKWWIFPANDGHQTAFFLEPSRREAKRMHSVAAAVSTSWVMGCETADACLDSALDELRAVEPDTRYTRTDVEVMPATSLPPGCVRVRVLQHDRGVPGQKQKTFEIHVDGMMCSHPDAPGLILNTSYSERLPLGGRRRGFAPDEVEEFLRGFSFESVGRWVVDSAQHFRESLGALTWDGATLWLQHSDKLSRIDTIANQAVHSIDVTGLGMALLVAEESLWMGDYQNRRLLRLHPETGAQLASLLLPGTPVDIAFSGDSVWITHEDHGDVVRVDTATNSITDAVAVGDANAGIVAAFGSIWVSNPSDNAVYRIDPDSASIVGKDYVCDTPLDLVAAGEFIWTGCIESGTIAQLDPTSGRVLMRYEVGGNPFMIDADDRQLWIVNNSQGTVSRFDTDLGKVTAKVPVGPNPIFVRLADGATWVVERSSGSLFRIVELSD